MPRMTRRATRARESAAAVTPDRQLATSCTSALAVAAQLPRGLGQLPQLRLRDFRQSQSHKGSPSCGGGPSLALRPLTSESPRRVSPLPLRVVCRERPNRLDLEAAHKPPSKLYPRGGSFKTRRPAHELFDRRWAPHPRRRFSFALHQRWTATSPPANFHVRTTSRGRERKRQEIWAIRRVSTAMFSYARAVHNWRW